MGKKTDLTLFHEFQNNVTRDLWDIRQRLLDIEEGHVAVSDAARFADLEKRINFLRFEALRSSKRIHDLQLHMNRLDQRIDRFQASLNNLWAALGLRQEAIVLHE